MPDVSSHLTLANHNQDLLDRLVPDPDEFPDWIATVAFYKALHIVEAALASEKPGRHGIDHNHREHLLKTDNRYQAIYRNYRVLYTASMVARYMHDGHTSFTNYLAPDRVISELLKYRLHEIEKSVLKKLKHPEQLASVMSRLAPSPAPGHEPPASE